MFVQNMTFMGMDGTKCGFKVNHLKITKATSLLKS